MPWHDSVRRRVHARRRDGNQPALVLRETLELAGGASFERSASAPAVSFGRLRIWSGDPAVRTWSGVSSGDVSGQECTGALPDEDHRTEIGVRRALRGAGERSDAPDVGPMFGRCANRARAALSAAGSWRCRR